MNIFEAFEVATEIRMLGEQLRTDQPDQQVVDDTLESLAWPLDEKLEALAKLRRMLVGSREAKIERAENINEQATRDTCAIHRVEELIQALLQASGRDRAQTALFTIALYKKAAVAAIDNQSDIPANYLRFPPVPPPEPDKRAILIALKAGRHVPGTHLEEGVRLSIR